MLRVAVKEISACLAEACPTQQLKSLSSEGDGQVVLQLTDASDKKVTVNIVFLDPEEYPRSGALVQLEDNGSSSGKLADRLGAASERFQDGAQLCAVLTKVGHQLRLDSCLTLMWR